MAKEYRSIVDGVVHNITKVVSIKENLCDICDKTLIMEPKSIIQLCKKHAKWPDEEEPKKIEQRINNI